MTLGVQTTSQLDSAIISFVNQTMFKWILLHGLKNCDSGLYLIFKQVAM